MKYGQHHHYATDKHEPPQVPMARVINWLSKRGTASPSKSPLTCSQRAFSFLEMSGAEGQSRTDTGYPTGF